ncbi:MAG: YtxH domain-containing protein [Bacillota bacterium]
MTFWRGLIAGSILGMIAGALLLPEMDENDERQLSRLRSRVGRLARAQRMVRRMTKLADMVK